MAEPACRQTVSPRRPGTGWPLDGTEAVIYEPFIAFWATSVLCRLPAMVRRGTILAAILLLLPWRRGSSRPSRTHNAVSESPFDVVRQFTAESTDCSCAALYIGNCVAGGRSPRRRRGWN